MTKSGTIRVDAPAGMHRLDIAQAVAGSHVLIKAEQLPGATVWYRDRALRELHARSYLAYREMFRRMVDAVRKYVEDNIIRTSLRKADLPNEVYFLTPEQLQEIREIVTTHHDAFVAGWISPQALPPDVLRKLVERGLLPQRAVYMTAGGVESMVRDAFRYGTALGNVESPDAKRVIERMTYEEWKKQPQPPMSVAEDRAVEFAEHASAVRVRGLGNRVADDFSTIAIEADKEVRAQYEGIIREKVSENIDRRDAWRKAASEMGHATEDWSRDFGRIAATEKMEAMIEGQARAMQDRVGDRDGDEVRVAKQPNPDACPDCLHHYTSGGVPKIFTLAELRENGSNAGRKRKDWLPTLGPLHPWCACELIEVPSGWEFDEEGNLSPSMLRRSDFEWNLRKSQARVNQILTYGDAVGDGGITVRVADPEVRAAVEEVVSRTPVQLFTRATGLTLITTDHARPQTAFDEDDLAYWAGNEIRLQQTIAPSRVQRVLEHEIGHALNTYLFGQLGGDVAKVRAWHDALWEVSRAEGFVSRYAKREPIENAAEVSRLYLYHKAFLRARFPRQFAVCHKAYGALFR